MPESVTCLLSTMQAVHNQTRPTFQDLNAVAAHALASLLCPARLRPSAVDSEEVSTPTTPGDPRMTPPPLRNSTNRRSSLTAPSPNSAQALSQVPVALGRFVTLGDILSQVQCITICRGTIPSHCLVLFSRLHRCELAPPAICMHAPCT